LTKRDSISGWAFPSFPNASDQALRLSVTASKLSPVSRDRNPFEYSDALDQATRLRLSYVSGLNRIHMNVSGFLPEHLLALDQKPTERALPERAAVKPSLLVELRQFAR
jgi:hypothetical protein